MVQRFCVNTQLICALYKNSNNYYKYLIINVIILNIVGFIFKNIQLRISVAHKIIFLRLKNKKKVYVNE
jgi:hypothetical protein